MKQQRSMLAMALVAVFVIVLGAAPQRAAAQNKAAAQALFADGRKLMQSGDYAAACSKFESSQRLDPALGTLLNLATCYEKLGRLASAWARYTEAADLAKHAGEAKREAYARGHAKALTPRLPHLRIVVSAPVDGLVVERNGQTVDPATYDTALPVDPGTVVLTAHAPGHESVSITVTATEGEETRAEIPALKETPAPSPPPVASASAPAQPTTTIPAPVVVATPHDHGEARPGHTQRLIGIAIGTTGVAALGASVAFGLSARSKWNQAFDGGCDHDTNVCDATGQKLADAARSRAKLGTIMGIAGGALIAAGTAVYLLARDSGDDNRVSLLPVAGRTSLGMSLEGRF